MIQRFLAPMGAIATVVMVVLLQQMPVVGQQAPSAESRTPWGDPDLQGVYTFSTNTPLERPKFLGNKNTFAPEELAEIEAKANQEYNQEDGPSRIFLPFAGALEPTTASSDVQAGAASPADVGTYNNFWTATEKGRLLDRTSLIVDPEDGRLPSLTPRAEKLRVEFLSESASRRVEGDTIYNNWADHPPFSRCLARPIPRIWQSYNHGVQILQTPKYVAIDYESMHDVRIIPLDGRPHLDASLQQWNGDSRGHWEGNTLVVDSANFSDKMQFEGSYSWGPPQGNMHLTERFTRVDANTINYEVIVEDPTNWTKPFTFILPWRADDPVYQKPEDLYEYACHEGNFRMMEDSLLGSRMLKQSQREKKE